MEFSCESVYIFAAEIFCGFVQSLAQSRVWNQVQPNESARIAAVQRHAGNGERASRLSIPIAGGRSRPGLFLFQGSWLFEPCRHSESRARIWLCSTHEVLDLLKIKNFVALFRNIRSRWIPPSQRACTLSSSAIAWFSCRLIMASNRNSLSSSSFSGKNR